MTGIDPADLDFCEQLVSRTDSSFMISRQFARPEIRDRLLILQSLIHEIRTVPWEISDPGVGIAKLGWWQKELSTGVAPESLHPVVRAMSRSGLLACVDAASLNNLLIGVMRLISGEPFDTTRDLQDVAKRIGGSESLLQASLDGPSAFRQELSELGMAGFFCRLLQRPDRCLGAGTWWMPLDLQAKHGVSIAGLEQNKHVSGLRGAVRELAGMAIELIRVNLERLHSPKNETIKDAGIHHVMILSAVRKKRLSRLTKQRRPAFENVFGMYGEVLAAWRQAVKNNQH